MEIWQRNGTLPEVGISKAFSPVLESLSKRLQMALTMICLKVPLIDAAGFDCRAKSIE